MQMSLWWCAAAVVIGVAPVAAREAPGDSPVRVVETFPGIFPETVDTLEHPWGEVEVVLNVDAAGQLVDWLIARSTHPAFARAAEDALRQWSYRPARRGGQPVSARTTLTIRFEAKSLSGGVVRHAFAMRRLDRLMRPPVDESISPARKLDAPLQVLETVSPLYPRNGDAQPARVVLDFFVDEAGRARMPVVVAAPDERFAAAAVEALSQWRFSPPRRDGKPVAVRAQQEFTFAAES